MMKKEKYNNEDGVWRTVAGRHIFIRTGQSLDEAMALSGKFDVERRINLNQRYKLTQEEAIVLQRYLSSYSYIINEQLRNDVKLSKIEENFVETLNSALDKMPNYEGTVVRDLYFDKNFTLMDKFVNGHEVGKTKNYDQFLSSTTASSYHDKPSVRLFIQSKTGKDIQGYNPREKEVLFKYGVEFKCLSIDKSDDKMTVIEVEEIDNG